MVCKDWHRMAVPILWRNIPELSWAQQTCFRQLVFEDHYYHEAARLDLPLLDRHLYACEQKVCRLDEEWEHMWQHAAQKESHEIASVTDTLRAKRRKVETDERWIRENPLELQSLQLPSSVLMKYGHFVREIPELYDLLKSFKLQDSTSQIERPYLADTVALNYDLLCHLMERLPNVQDRLLEIQQRHFWHTSLMENFIQLVIPMATELRIGKNNSVDVSVSALRGILSAASGLTRLHVDIHKVVGDTQLGAAPTIDDIPQFKAGLIALSISIEDQNLPVKFWTGLWRDCPSVVGLTVGNVVPGLVEILKKDIPVHLPNLNCLRMCQALHGKTCGISDDDIATMLMVGTGWKVIETNPSAQMGPRSLSALTRHYLTLRELILDQDGVRSSTLVDILSSCPNLQTLDTLGKSDNSVHGPKFGTRAVHADHFIDCDKKDTDTFRPWACEGTLQHLTIGLSDFETSHHEARQELRAKVCGRLARFARLKV
ncbi:hypothetical protein CPB97_006341, partial [Podila verticillata]